MVGPGPGSPDIPEDVGIVKYLWKLDKSRLLPIFGVCLGLQSLATEFGAKVKKLPVVKHGQVSIVEHTGSDIFEGVRRVQAVRYHSLHAELDDNQDLKELAWCTDADTNGRVVMALKHTKRPFWAVQYHPESVLTSGGGIEVILNFWRLSRRWNVAHNRTLQQWDTKASSALAFPWPNPRPPLASGYCPPSRIVLTSAIHLPGLHTVTICELLGVTDDHSPFVMLESASEPGRHTVIGCLHPTSPRILYSIGEKHLCLQQGDLHSCEYLGSGDIWSWTAAFMNRHKASCGLSNVPFWGGFIGYLSYELGVESLSLPSTVTTTNRRHPDMNLVFVERSIVVDSTTGMIYLQSILDGDSKWLADMGQLLNSAAHNYSAYSPENLPSSTKAQTTIIFPDKDNYKSRIHRAKDHLFAGESYELCLTAPTRIIIDKLSTSGTSDRYSSSWQRYKMLRELNPAPHASYLRLHPTTLVASSPERFLSWSRPPRSIFQLRPIKGTVRKGPDVTRAIAEEALRGSPKEVAENLMIVDLIRHDLHHVVGEDVEVKQFCSVEEYSTVWQLVSVIEGKSAKGIDQLHAERANGALGWELLKRSLPPGEIPAIHS